ncbi:MAG TPA: hypothetical protein VKE40_22445 [Gemmataceae bacterium]|nr:hypothetical protein [Gemmataceae bacterium]
MKVLRPALLVAGIICTILFFSSNVRYVETREGEHRIWGVGLDISPWIKQDRSSGRTTMWEINFFSWSWLVGIAGCAAFWGYRRLGCIACAAPTKTPQPATPAP